MNEINRRMTRGASWMVLMRLVDRGLGLISTLFLARLLVPADFGLVAMATAFIGVLELLGSFSFDLALIQNQRAERRHYDTAWTFNVLFGVVSALVLCALAVPASRFYGEHRIEAILLALAPAVLASGFENIGVVAFQKELELHKEFWFRFAKRIAGFVVTLVLAFLWRNYWALVVGVLVSRVAGVVVSYAMHPYRPRFSLEAARELMSFSLWLLVNNVLIFVNNRGMDFIVGKFSGARSVGLYGVAYEISNLPTTELVYPIQRAVYPGYALNAHDPVKLKETFLDVQGITALLAVPAGVGIGIVASPLVAVMLGKNWTTAADLMPILAAFGIVRVLHGSTGGLYLALAKPHRIAVFQAVQVAVTIVALFALLPRLGLQGAAWSALLGALAAAVANFSTLNREIGLAFPSILARIWRPAASAATMIPICHAVSAYVAHAMPSAPQFVYLLAMVGAGAIDYVLCLLLLWHLSGRAPGSEASVLSKIGLGRLAARD